MHKITNLQVFLDIHKNLVSNCGMWVRENAPKDYYWGSGKDGSGKNRLGQILMEVRAILRQPAKAIQMRRDLP